MSRKDNSKPVCLDEDFYGKPAAVVEPLHLDKLKLECNGTKAHFEMLLYKNVPNYSTLGKKKDFVDYIPVSGREPFIRKVYRILETDFNRTKRSKFYQIIKYLRWMDSNHLEPINEDYFAPDLYNAYMNYHQEKCNRGEQAIATWGQAKSMLSFFLKADGRSAEARNLKKIEGAKKQAKSYTGIDVVGELKPLVRRFIAAFGKFRAHFLDGSKLDIHPLWDEDLFYKEAEKQQWNARKMACVRQSFKVAVCSENSIRNHFSRLAAMLVFCFTGQNTTPLLNLRFSDIRFTSKLNGKVYFDMTKARANYLKFDTSLGFHKKTQEFLHQWLEVSMGLQKEAGTDWVFPYFRTSGDIQGMIEAGNGAPQKSINNYTKKLGLVHVNPSKLRQTKIDTLMKVTEDIWLVSMSANNTIEVIGRNYSGNNESEHVTSLAANGDALYEFSKNGTDPYEAAKKSKYNYASVISDYNYKKLREEERAKDTQTPLGVRCKDSSKGVAARIKKNLGKMGIEQSKNDERCTDFLGCFECPYHRLVAEIEDIWLMLSFNDTLKEMKDYPAINSLPTDKFHKLCNTIESILKRFKEVAPDNYTEAQQKLTEASHPLYSDGYSLVDLLEAF